MVEENNNTTQTTTDVYTVLCAAFCGTGKSYLCDKFSDIYKEVECWYYRDGDFPNNYIEDVINLFGKTKYLFISTDPVILRKVNELGIEIHLFYPLNELRNEYLDRFIERNSPYDFIGAVMKNWDIWINELKEQTYCKHNTLKSGEYLQDVL